MRPPLRPCPPHAQQEEAAEVSRALGSRPTALPGKRATCTIVATSTPALCQCGTHFPCLLHARTGPKKATPAPSDPVTPAGPVMVAVTPEPPWESLQRVSPAGPNLELPMATTPRRGHQGGSRAERRAPGLHTWTPLHPPGQASPASACSGHRDLALDLTACSGHRDLTAWAFLLGKRPGFTAPVRCPSGD